MILSVNNIVKWTEEILYFEILWPFRSHKQTTLLKLPISRKPTRTTSNLKTETVLSPTNYLRSINKSQAGY